MVNWNLERGRKILLKSGRRGGKQKNELAGGKEISSIESFLFGLDEKLHYFV